MFWRRHFVFHLKRKKKIQSTGSSTFQDRTWNTETPLNLDSRLLKHSQRVLEKYFGSTSGAQEKTLGVLQDCKKRNNGEFVLMKAYFGFWKIRLDKPISLSYCCHMKPLISPRQQKKSRQKNEVVNEKRELPNL